MRRKSLNNGEDMALLLERIGRLEENTTPRWGKMNAAQMLQHCTWILQTATGEVLLPETNIVYSTIGRITKYTIWLTGIRIPPDMPTYDCVRCMNDCEFESSRMNLINALEHYSAAASEGTLRPRHRLFGRMNLMFWGLLEYKHLNHHLKQFKV